MLLLVVGLSGFHAPLGSGTRHRHGAVLSSADEYEIKPAKGTEEKMAEAADFFVDGFWLAGTTTAGVELSGSERSQLAKLSTDDMMGRYGELVGQRRLRSKLYVARDSAGTIVGCVGVEAAMVDMVDSRVLTRAQGEALFAQEFAVMGGAERGLYRKMSLAELTEELLPEYKCFGLLANLAVAPSTRGKGLARRLCAQCDTAAAKWELPAISLQVDGANTAANSLYASLGYSEIWQDAAPALRLRPGAKELLASEASTLITMAKGV